MTKIKLNCIFTFFIFFISSLYIFMFETIKGNITISGAWAIYPTAVAWAEAFQKKYPDVKIDISAGGAGKGAADAIAGLVDIGMVSREPDPAELQKGIIPIYILHDAVFPIVSKKNPVINLILKNGIKKADLEKLYIKNEQILWSNIYPSSIRRSIHVYTRSDSCGAASAFAGYFNKKQEDLNGIGIYGDPGLIDAVKRDPLGVGYTNFGYVFDRNGKIIDGIEIIPIDINENGIAEVDEKCDNRYKAIKLINEGKYPILRKNYFFIKDKASGLVIKFIEFVLSDEGAKIVEEVGTSIPILKEEREAILKKLR